jgi:hypothetical protein
MSSSNLIGEGREARMGSKEREPKGSAISDVGETLGVRPLEEDRRVTSSKVFKITTLGSVPASLSALDLLVGLLVTEPLASDLDFSEASSTYSGRVEKLSGITTTWYVPGLEASAFLSRSSSDVRREKAGSASLEEK